MEAIRKQALIIGCITLIIMAVGCGGADPGPGPVSTQPLESAAASADAPSTPAARESGRGSDRDALDEESLIEMAEYAQASEFFYQAIELDPESSAGWWWLGRVDSAGELIQNAIQNVDEAILNDV